MRINNYGTETVPKWFTVTTVSINGEVKEIIPAFTDSSIKPKDFSKDPIFQTIDRSKILDTVFCFTDSQVFIQEAVKLYDYYGREITDISEEMPPVMVYLDKTDNINLLDLIEVPLPVKLISCSSVADAYQRVATTAYLSQSPSKNDWIGFAGIVTKDELLLQIRKFGIEFGMNGTTAQGYFGLSTTVSMLQNKAILLNNSLPKAEYRTYEQAKNLMKATVQAFGVKTAKQTRYIKAINYCVGTYTLDTIIKALNHIGATEKLELDVATCEDKVNCLQNIITTQALEFRKSA